MLVSVVLEHSEVASAEGYADFVVDHGVDSGAVYVEDTKARVLVVISLKTYTQIIPVPTNNRPVDCGWTVSLALPPGLPLSTAGEALVEASTRSLVNK